MKKLISIMMAFVMTVAITVVPVQASAYPDQEQILTLKNKISNLKSQGYSMEYEEMMYNVIYRFFDTYIPSDTTKGIDSDVLAYEKNAVAELYTELLADVNAYEAGTKTPLTVAKPDMNNLTVSGGQIYDDENPVYSIGYGFFGHAQTDIPNFQSFGASNIQMEIGPHQTWGTGSNGWNIYTGVEGLSASATVESGTSRTGSKSLHMVFSDTSGETRYVAAERLIPCKPNTTYTMGVWAKGSATDWNAWMTFDWVASGRIDFVNLSTTEWKKFERTYTTDADQTSMSPLVLVENTADLYLDDFYVYEHGSTINLLANPGLETEVYQAVEDMKVHLNNAEQNNVGVSLLLSPHYIENIAEANGITLTSDDSATFIRFDINNAKVKEIIEAHMRGVLESFQDYTCIDSICISNEPWFDTRWFDDYQTEYRNYLLEKHGSFENVRDLYGLSSLFYNDVTDIDMPETNFFGNYSINAKAYDWMEFNDKVFTEWHEWMAGIVKEYFPNTPIHSKVMENIITSGETKERVELSRGTDYDMFGKFFGYSGIDGSNYTTDDYNELMFMYEYLQSSVGKPVYNSETHIIKDYGWDSDPEAFEFSTNTTTKALYKMWQGAIHGRNLSTVWAWQRHYTDGDDATTSAIVVPDSDSNKSFYGSVLFRPDLVAGLGKMNLDFARLGGKIAELQENSEKVAIFYSKPSRLWNASHITSVLSVYKELIANGYDTGVITERSIDKLSQYDTLVIPANTEYTTQAARTAVESFAANGGKVLYAETDALSLSEYNKSLGTLSVGSTYSVSALPEKKVVLKDTSGNIISNAEWQYSVTDDKILVNVASTVSQDVEVYYNGNKISGLTNLISAEEGISTVSLAAYEPALLEYTLLEVEDNEILDLELESANSKIIWKAVGANIGSVTIYKVDADKSVTYITNTTAKEYAYSEDGTYIVCPVTKAGEELEGITLTTPCDIALSVTYSGGMVKSTITNNCGSYMRAKVLAEAYIDGEVVSYGFVRTFIPLSAAHNIDILLPVLDDVDSVKVTVYDDLNNILAEVEK